MAHQYLLLMPKVTREFFGKIDGAVLSAGATYGNGKVAAVIGDKTGQPAFHEIADVAKHLLDIGNIFQEFDHWRIATVE